MQRHLKGHTKWRNTRKTTPFANKRLINIQAALPLIHATINQSPNAAFSLEQLLPKENLFDLFQP